MLRRAAAGTFAVVASAALAWAGGDAKVYDIDWRDRWTAGQVVTVTVHETTDMDMTMDGKPMRSAHDVLDATYVVRCDTADARGNSTSSTVFVKSWKKTKGATADESISGALVTVEGRTWKIADGRTPGALAKKWLDSKFSRNDDGGDPLSRLAPPKMSVGQTWKPDSKDVAESFGKSMEGAPFDVTGMTMEITLVSVEGAPPDAKGRFEFKVHMPINAAGGLPAGATLSAGAGADATGDHTAPLTTSTVLSADHMNMDLTMVLNLPKEAGGASVATKGRVTSAKSTVAGGEIPSGPPPAAPDPPKPPRPAAQPEPPPPGGK